MTIGIYKLCARDVMTRRADTIRAQETIHNAIETMVNLGLSALPVVDEDEKCVGVITKSDIIRLAGQLGQEQPREDEADVAATFFGVGLGEITDKTVRDVMATHVIRVGEEESVMAIADTMLKHEVHHVPICNEDDRVIGVVSTMDLVKAIRAPLSV
jgi:CBS domain-containing protein